jgi:hypothetical protein
MLGEEIAGARGGGRTHNLRLRRPTLYPIELRAQILSSEDSFCWQKLHRIIGQLLCAVQRCGQVNLIVMRDA